MLIGRNEYNLGNNRKLMSKTNSKYNDWNRTHRGDAPIYTKLLLLLSQIIFGVKPAQPAKPTFLTRRK